MKLDLKGVLLYAIVPAVLTGIISITPKLYDIYTTPKASLEYSETSGPEVHLNSGVKKIISISVWNNGTRRLSNITTLIQETGNTEIESSTLNQNTGLSVQKTQNPQQTKYVVNNLFPRERFSIALMLTGTGSIHSPQISIRSLETPGNEYHHKINQKPNISDLLGALLAAFSVFLMGIALKINPGIISIIEDKLEIHYYIALRLGLTSITKDIRFEKKHITYMRMADIFLDYGLHADADGKEKAIKALKCLLLIKGIAERSSQVIVGNLKLLEGEKFSEHEVQTLKEKSQSLRKLDLLRKTINEFNTI